MGVRATRSPLYLALILFAVYSAHSLLPKGQKSEDRGQRSEVRIKSPSPRDLPNDCAIVATEAAARLAATGVWTQVIFLKYFEPQTKRIYGHALVVWQPPTAHIVCIYDATGTYDLATEKHDPAEIGKLWAVNEHVFLLDAHFLK
jgi:hypothetical protein